jgi:hypothetical protein
MFLFYLIATCATYSSLIVALPVTDNDVSSIPTVRVKNGTYSGIYSPEYGQDFFLGMPYAQVNSNFSHSHHCISGQ